MNKRPSLRSANNFEHMNETVTPETLIQLIYMYTYYIKSIYKRGDFHWQDIIDIDYRHGQDIVSLLLKEQPYQS